MMFAQTHLLVLVGLGALMTPALAADTTTTPTCGDAPGPSVECSAGGKDWKCPPSNTCGKQSPACEMTFEVCTPSAESTKPPKTTAPATKTDAAPVSSGTGTTTGSAPSNTSSGSAAPGLVVGSWSAVVMGIVAGGLAI